MSKKEHEEVKERIRKQNFCKKKEQHHKQKQLLTTLKICHTKVNTTTCPR